MLVWALQRARQGDKKNEARIRKVMTLMTSTMVDKTTGAMNQVNLKPDWSEPAREFPMFAQEAGLVGYARAWTMFGDPAYRQAADRIYGGLHLLYESWSKQQLATIYQFAPQYIDGTLVEAVDAHYHEAGFNPVSAAASAIQGARLSLRARLSGIARRLRQRVKPLVR